MAVESESGAEVRAGDVLIRLDARQVNAQLAGSEAQLAKDEAQLEQVFAKMRTAMAVKKFATDEELEAVVHAVLG